MNNIKRSGMLIVAAKESLAEAKYSFKRSCWPLVIRRCQECVELSLSSCLAYLGIHYPKNHDQAPLLLNVLKAQQINVDTIEKKLEMISLDLSRKRGPALQQEEGYDQKEAEEAIKDADFVLVSADNFLMAIKNKYC